MMKETPEQKFRREERDKKFALLAPQERSIKLMHSWAEEFYKTRQREDRNAVIFTFFLALNTLLLVLVVT